LLFIKNFPGISMTEMKEVSSPDGPPAVSYQP
jgi:hypothetical protein